MKKILTVFAVFLFTAFSVFAEMDFRAAAIYQPIFDSQYAFSKYHGSDTSSLEGELYKHGEIGGDIAVTYFLTEYNDSLQPGFYVDLRYLKQFTGDFYYSRSSHSDDNDLTGDDMCLSVGIKGRFNLNRIFFADLNAGVFANLNIYYSDSDDKFTAGTLGAEIGGDLGFRVMNTGKFGTAIIFGANGKVGGGSGTIKSDHHSDSEFQESVQTSIDVFAGVDFMLKK